MNVEVKSNRKFSLGVTLIELLLVISIFVIVSSMTASFGAGFLQRNNFRNTTNDLASKLRTAQINSISSYKGQRWGVRVTAEQIIMYGQDDPANDIFFDIPSNVSVTQEQVLFDNLTGEPDSTKTYTIYSGGEIVILNINEEGIVDIN